MKKYFVTLIAIVFLLSACENTVKEDSTSEEEVVIIEEIVPVSISNFETKAEDLVGKQIILSGTVDHICQHGGQKMFIIETGSEGRIKITPDENIAAFNTELEGQNIKVIGIVEEQRIDEEYLREWEEEILADADMADDKGEGMHLGGNVEKGGEDADKSEELEKVNNLRQQITESGKDHLSFFSVLCTDYEVVETDDSEPVQE